MKYTPVEAKDNQDVSTIEICATEAETPTSSENVKSETIKGIKTVFQSLTKTDSGKRRLKIIATLIPMSVIIVITLALLSHYRRQYYGKDSTFKSFREYFVERGREMTDALPNGTFVLNSFEPSRFDKTHGIDYSIKDLCRDTKWHKDLYLVCGPVGNWGGLWNNHNAIMGCVRRAIDAGLGIVMPSIVPRSTATLNSWDLDNPVSLDFLFDSKILKNGLSEQCPQLNIKESDYKFKNIIELPRLDVATEFQEFRDFFEGFANKIGFDLENHSETLFHTDPSVCNWNFRDGGFKIHKQFYELLQFTNRNDHLTDSIISRLPKEYISFHMRAEYDFGRTTFEPLADWFLTLVKDNYPVKTVYIAVGTEEVENKFREFMKPYGWTVHSKWSIIADDSKLTEQMKKLKFDELAIIEHQVLLKSKKFYGVTSSTLSWATALIRGQFDMGKSNSELYEGNFADLEFCY